jgi:hypothetical protein
MILPLISGSASGGLLVPEDHRWAVTGSIAGVLGVIVAVIGIVVAHHDSASGGTLRGTAPSTSAPSIVPSSSESSTLPSPTAPRIIATSPSATQPSVVYLSDMNDQTGSAIAEPVTIKGISYIHSIHYGDENSGGGLGQGTGERDAEFIYDLGGAHYSSFDAMLGFLDEPTDPEAVVQFTVKVDGVIVASESCSRYSACPIHAQLPVGSQLILSMQLIKWTPASQIDYFPDAYPAWGDARLN